MILVTGGAGYIGSHVCVELLESGYEVAVIDNLSNSRIEAIKNIEKITGKKVMFYKADVRDRFILGNIFRNNNIKAVIHLAGLKSTVDSIKRPLDYYLNNINGLLNLLEVMNTYNVRKLIFSSSATVYGKPNELPIDETHPIGNTTNPYGFSKYVQENILQDLYKSNKDWNITILRYFNSIGAHESGLIGENLKGIPSNLVPYIAKVACGELPKVYVCGNDYDTPDGTCIRDYIHVVDLAKGHSLAVKNINKNGVHIYNLGTGKGYSVLEVIKEFEEASGHHIEYQIVNRRDGDIDISYANVDKAKEELGWKAEKTLSDMCDDSWNYISHIKHIY